MYNRVIDVSDHTPEATPKAQETPERVMKVPWGPIGESVYRRTYSFLKNGRTIREIQVNNEEMQKLYPNAPLASPPAEDWETWPETVKRVVDGNLAFVPRGMVESGEREKLIKWMLPFGLMPGGRHIAATGLHGRQFVQNCLSGKTKVHTRQWGLVPISFLADKGDVEVLAQGQKEKTGVDCWTYGPGEWRKASFSSFGKQKLFLVTFSDGTTVEATAGHKWYVTKRSNPVETKNLTGHNVPFVTSHKPEKNNDYRTGILHGFTYGDGCVNRKSREAYQSHVSLFGEKDASLIPLFEAQEYTVSYPKYCGGYVGSLPVDWKAIPHEDAGRPYWYGFLVGLLAADGTVSEQSGSVIQYQSDREALETIREKAIECGFACTPIMPQLEKNPWTGESATNWRYTYRRFSVQPQELIIPQHRLNFTEAGEPTNGKSLEVVEVRDLNKEEEVYCAVEPETHTFVIENALLTGNCHAAGYDPQDPAAHFTFMFDHLMQGGGVGSNYSNRYLENLPPIKNEVEIHIVCRGDHPDYAEIENHLATQTTIDGVMGSGPYIRHEVADSREGWVESGGILLNAAYGNLKANTDRIGKRVIVFDVSGVRKKGAILITSGGKAAGPGPLVDLLRGMAVVMRQCVGRRLTSIDAMNLDHAIAKCVVAGGKRRSSRMSVKSWKDSNVLDFISCKEIDGKHWTTNISVEIDNDFFKAYSDLENPMHAVAYMVFHESVQAMRKNGEPGFWNRSLSQVGERDPELMFCPNPCGEICLYMWESCNLGHVNLEFFAKHPLNQTKEAFRLMTRFLMRATFSDIPNGRQKEVVSKNRRIGVGFMGFHPWVMLHGIKYSEAHANPMVAKRLSEFRAVVDSEKVSYAAQLGIPVPVKGTSEAPNGTGALLPGTTSAFQAMFSPWGIRRVRMSDTDTELATKTREGYPVYVDPQARNTKIVEFWYEDPLIAKLKSAGLDPEMLVEGQDDIPFDVSLSLQRLVQTVYADNAVSFTINVPNKKRPSLLDMKNSLLSHLPFLKGTTYFPDVSRSFPPFERKTKAEFDAYTGPKEIATIEQECLNGACPVK